ncbi:MAG TPA: sodium:phosphate symporter [Microscillaceae bacterium]|nr:sodium:phosphate symporter [Microscillaceae bacterium]
MSDSIDFWKFLAGLSIFLVGLFFLENALQNLAGGSFKKFLRKHTQNPFKAILSGTLVTAILQSSSVVTLIILAFVGAGVMTLQNALGVIIGSNLGTTFTGWIVATLGFKLDIESFSLPFIAVGGLLFIFFQHNKRLLEFGRMILGFGLLFLGLNFMKASIELLSKNFDLSPYISHGPYALFVVGFILTAIIQSSSAAMVITLSALNAGILPLESAAGMVIGSDLGTTITTILGGLRGTPAKKRVALSHFIFNLVTDLIALVLLYPLLHLVTKIMGITDQLMTLVVFHSMFNLLGIVIALPLLKVFAQFLENRFKSSDGLASQYINKVTADVPDTAISAMQKEIEGLISLVFVLHLKILKINLSLFSFKSLTFENEESTPQTRLAQDYHHIYATIQQLEGELVPFYLNVQNQQLDKEEFEQLNKLIQAIRHAMIAAKGLKNIIHNIDNFEKSANDSKIALFDLLKGQLHEFYLTLHHVLSNSSPDLLENSSKENRQIHDDFLQEIYRQINKGGLNELDIHTLLNVNREIYNANHYLILAIEDTLIPGE